MDETNENTLCVLVGERRTGGGIWPLVTINLPESGDATMTGRKSAHLAVPVLKRALMAAELQAVRNGPVVVPDTLKREQRTGPEADRSVRAPLEESTPLAAATAETTLYSAGDGY